MKIKNLETAILTGWGTSDPFKMMRYDMNPLAKLMAMHKTIMAELEDAIEKSKNINNDENNTGRM